MVLIEEVTEPEIKPVKVEEKKQVVEKKIENVQEWFKIAKIFIATKNTKIANKNRGRKLLHNQKIDQNEKKNLLSN